MLKEVNIVEQEKNKQMHAIALFKSLFDANVTYSAKCLIFNMICDHIDKYLPYLPTLSANKSKFYDEKNPKIPLNFWYATLKSRILESIVTDYVQNNHPDFKTFGGFQPR